MLNQIVGDSFQLKLNEFSKDVENLQNKCICRSNVPQSNLIIKGILQDFSMIGTNLVDRKFVVEGGGIQKSVVRAIMEILSFQNLMPNQMNAKEIAEMFGRLFSVLSTEINKLEKVENKIARDKRFKKIIEKSAKSKKAG